MMQAIIVSKGKAYILNKYYIYTHSNDKISATILYLGWLNNNCNFNNELHSLSYYFSH